MINLATIPYASVQPIVNIKQAWVALHLHLPADLPFQQVLPLLCDEQGFLEKVSKLTFIVPCADPFAIQAADLGNLPNGRVILLLPTTCCQAPNLEAHLRTLQSAGLRFMLDGCVAADVQPPAQIASLFIRSEAIANARATMRKFSGLHCVLAVDSMRCLDECKAVGFSWFGGQFLLSPSTAKDEGTSRARLLRLLALVEQDADVRELENMLKQDMALSFHLLKLVNSAAFTPSTPITSFAQAINVLGRRQLQRWLQLLLYARPVEAGQANPLLPLAALRASLMEGLVTAQGASREMQDQAFMVGMFSLLHLVLDTALTEVVAALKLDAVIVDALLQKTGPLGEVLHVVEQVSLDGLTPKLDHLKIAQADYWQAMISAYQWASVVMQEA